jgi:cell division protein FtsL
MIKVFNIAAACLALALAIGLYRAKTEAEAARARIAILKEEVGVIRAEVDTLAAEAAHLSAPDRIERLAREKLALKPASPGQVLSGDELVLEQAP